MPRETPSAAIDPSGTRGLAVTTVIGALGGVWAVHLVGWVEGARTAMGLVHVAVALRFASDVLRGRRT